MSVLVNILGLLIAVTITSPTYAEELVVIVHAQRTVEPSLEDIAQIYLKKRRFWSDGDPIVPVNRDARSRAREFFVRTVFGTELRQLAVYWNREYFRGVLPPATLASDEAVRRFVASEPRAIGYVHPSAVDDSVKIAARLSNERSRFNTPDVVESTDN
jgi:ABC-type phosphate transport system substrate-binding protein